MRSRPGFLGGALRLAAVGAVLAALLPLLWYAPVEPASASAGPAPLPEPVPPASGLAADAPSPGTWSLRANGWYIRVDGAEIAVPSVAQQVAPRPGVRQTIVISPFDRLIAHHASTQGFDWRLIAAIIFEESRFKPDSVSDKGAYGLMQVRRIAAETIGVEHFKAPHDNIHAGVRYLRYLDALFADAKPEERIGLVLAAYNMGPGHVRDAQKLARRFGFDPNRWEGHMERMLPLLEQPAIHQGLTHGFAKGRSTAAYVARIIDRYHQYRRETGAPPGLAGDALLSAR